jgi:hypothetical protein
MEISEPVVTSANAEPPSQPTGAIREILVELIRMENEIKKLQAEAKEFRQQHKNLSSNIQEHMQTNAIRAFSLFDKYNISLVNATKFPRFTPETVYPVIEAYFDGNERPTALGVTEALFTWRKTGGSVNQKLRIRSKK